MTVASIIKCRSFHHHFDKILYYNLPPFQVFFFKFTPINCLKEHCYLSKNTELLRLQVLKFAHSYIQVITVYESLFFLKFIPGFYSCKFVSNSFSYDRYNFHCNEAYGRFYACDCWPRLYAALNFFCTTLAETKILLLLKVHNFGERVLGDSKKPYCH